MAITLQTRLNLMEPAKVYPQILRLLGGGQPEEAAHLCDALLAEHPALAEALVLRAAAAYALGEPEMGKRFHVRAEDSTPRIKHFSYLDGFLAQQHQLTPANSLINQFVEYRKSAVVDCYVLSYPKCGRTWLRLLLSRMIEAHFQCVGMNPLDIFEMTRMVSTIPTLDFTHDDMPHWKPAAAIHRDKEAYRGKQVLLLVRDPRDVIVSSYFEYTKRRGREIAQDASYAGTLAEYLHYEIGGIDNIIGFYNAWAAARTIPARFHLIRYEALKQEAAATLRTLLDFLSIRTISDVEITAAIEACSFEKMRALESSKTLGPRLAAADPSDPESFKVRKGKVGGYRDYLSEKDIAWLDHKITTELDDFYHWYK